MQLTIYIDLILGMNFIVDFFVLYLTGKILRQKVKIWRLLLSALFGAGMLLGFVFFPALFVGIKGILMFIGISIGTGLIAYGMRRCVATWFLSTTIMILIGNAMNYLKSAMGIQSLRWFQWFIFFAISMVFVRYGLHLLQSVLQQEKNTYLVQIKHGEQRVVEHVLLDTGNLLKDPLYDKPVIVLSEKVVECCLSQDEQNIIKQYREKGKLDYSMLLTNHLQKKDGFHEITYQSVGNPSGKMLCMLLEEVVVTGCGRTLHRQPVAIAPSELFEQKTYQGLLHEDCI